MEFFRCVCTLEFQFVAKGSLDCKVYKVHSGCICGLVAYAWFSRFGVIVWKSSLVILSPLVEIKDRGCRGKRCGEFNVLRVHFCLKDSVVSGPPQNRVNGSSPPL